MQHTIAGTLPELKRIIKQKLQFSQIIPIFCCFSPQARHKYEGGGIKYRMLRLGHWQVGAENWPILMSNNIDDNSLN